MWKKDITCKFCKAKFSITEESVLYDDLRNPIFFVPDYQYFVKCINCNENLILSNIPSDVAIRIQENFGSEKNEM